MEWPARATTQKKKRRQLMKKTEDARRKGFILLRLHSVSPLANILKPALETSIKIQFITLRPTLAVEFKN